ncbi:MAG: hypothetical protein JWN34_2341 [Bryobacterales bacterium]|nr:hypothetical protein [Bryobacterales bacterium]
MVGVAVLATESPPKSAWGSNVVPLHSLPLRNRVGSVFYDGTDYWLANGFHRLRATYELDRDDIEANIPGHHRRCPVVQLRREHDERAVSVERGQAEGGAGRAEACEVFGPERPPDPEALPCGCKDSRNLARELAPSMELPKVGSRTVTRNGTTYQQNTADISRKSRWPKWGSAATGILRALMPPRVITNTSLCREYHVASRMSAWFAGFRCREGRRSRDTWESDQCSRIRAYRAFSKTSLRGQRVEFFGSTDCFPFSKRIGALHLGHSNHHT